MKLVCCAAACCGRTAISVAAKAATPGTRHVARISGLPLIEHDLIGKPVPTRIKSGAGLLRIMLAALANLFDGCWQYFAPSIRERPHPELLLADLPQPRQPERLDDEEDD